MRAKEFIFEGGWDTTLTQNTVIGPKVVKAALSLAERFTKDFNKYLSEKGLPPVRVGRPTGSSAYHDVDPDDKVYGDIDLQMVAPEVGELSYGQFTAYWNKLADEFVRAGYAPYVDTSESKPGHPIFAVGNDMYVQVDFMWHPERLEKWGAARVTPEHNVKGLLFGNMFSALGEILDLSIQHAGVQLKVVDDQHVPFSKQKGTKTITVTTNPETFLLDLFNYEAKQMGVGQPAVDDLLKQFPGNDINDVKIEKLANGIKGLARSFEINGMYGRDDLANFTSAADFVSKFVARYEEKAMLDVNAKKRDKAQTPQAIARAEQDRQKVLGGLQKVKSYFK